VWVRRAVHIVHAIKQRRPATDFFYAGDLADELGVSILLMELLHVGGGPIDEWRASLCKFLQEQWVWLTPFEADGGFVNHRELRPLPVHQHKAWQADRVEFVIEGHVFKPEAEIFSSEGAAVRPFVSFPQVQREDLVIVIVDTFQNVWIEFKVLVVADQARIPPDVDEANVFGA